MGMDVYGRKAADETGRYFRNNVWWWRPLWDYCCQVAPDLIPPRLAQQGHYNDGAGLGAAASRNLAARLREYLASGECQRYADTREVELVSLPNKQCKYCGGTGDRKDLEPPEWKAECGGCNACHGKGTVRPFEESYLFSVDNVADFATFLESSGGFAIR